MSLAIGAVLITLIVILSLICIHFQKRVVKAEDNLVKMSDNLKEMAFQLEINNSLISDEVYQAKICQVLKEESAGKLNMKQVIDIGSIILHIWKLGNIPPSISMAVLKQESKFTPNIESSGGALGIAQVMPSNCISYLRMLQIDYTNMRNTMFDPVIGTRVGLSVLHDLSILKPGLGPHYYLSCYNMGDGATNKMMAEGKGFESAYSKNVLRIANIYQRKGIP